MADSVNGHFSYKGFEAWILVDNKPLPHFGVEHDGPMNAASAWIPSEAGKKFTVHYRKTMQDENGYRARLFLDGYGADERMHHDQNRILETKGMSCVEISPTEWKYFVFNPVALTDDDEYLDAPIYAGIGEIRLILQPAKALNAPPKPIRFRNVQPETTHKVHEWAKKGLVHQIKFSESNPREYHASVEIPIEPVGEPVTFIFKYRPLDVLQASGIAPRPTPPVEAGEDNPRSSQPLASVKKSEEEDTKLQPSMPNVLKQEDDDEGDEGNDNDDNEITKREQALLAELKEVRNRKRAMRGTVRHGKRVKKESIIHHFRPREVIDLTRASGNPTCKASEGRIY